MSVFVCRQIKKQTNRQTSKHKDRQPETHRHTDTCEVNLGQLAVSVIHFLHFSKREPLDTPEASLVGVRDVVLETAVSVSRALETNFVRSWSWS